MADLYDEVRTHFVKNSKLDIELNKKWWLTPFLPKVNPSIFNQLDVVICIIGKIGTCTFFNIQISCEF
jgi:hypothetical protein